MGGTRFTVLLGGSLGIGAALRLFNLRDQVLVGDERWDVSAALAYGPGEIFSHLLVSNANYAPPLSGLYWLVSASGWPLDEATLRAPVLLCGVAAIALLPLLWRRFIGAPSAGLLALLLALSPALVVYSRLVRGYMPLVLASSCALAAFALWSETRSRRTAFAYAALAALSIDLHLLAAPFVLAPFVAIAWDLWHEPRERARWRSVALLAAATLGATALLIAPSGASILWLLEHRSSHASPGLDVIEEVALRLVGTFSVPVALAFAVAGLRGLWILRSRHPRFAALSLSAVVAQLLAVWIVSPAGATESVLFARYVVVVVPVLLAWVALGLAHPWRRSGGWWWAQALGVAMFIGSLVATGPLATREVREGSFAHAALRRSWGAPSPAAPVLENERFYLGLRQEGRSGDVIECLWHDVVFSETAPGHQRTHGQRVLVASPLDDWWSDDRLALRNTVQLDRASLLASAGRWVVVHLRPVEEEWRVRERDPRYRKRIARLEDFARNYELAQGDLARRFRRHWGAPVYEDDWILAWDLDRVRSQLSRQADPD